MSERLTIDGECNLLHVADLHLGRGHGYLGARSAERRIEADGVIDRIVDFAVDPAHSIRAVLIAGDLFDTPNPPEELTGRVLAALARLEGAGIRVVTVPGNHDEYSYPDSVYRRHEGRWPGVLITSPEPALSTVLELGGRTCRFYGFAYTAGLTPTPLPPIPVDGEGRRIGVFHASVDMPGPDRSAHLTGAELANLGLDYAALGHIHKPGRWAAGAGLACYPGLIEGRGFDDIGGSPLVVVNLDGSSPRMRSVPFPSRKIEVREVDVGTFESREAVEEHLRSMADDQLVLRVRLVGAARLSPDPDFLQSLLGGLFYHLEIEDRASVFGDAAITAIGGEETIRGLFARKMIARIEAAVDTAERTSLDRALRIGLEAFGSWGRP